MGVGSHRCCETSDPGISYSREGTNIVPLFGDLDASPTGSLEELMLNEGIQRPPSDPFHLAADTEELVETVLPPPGRPGRSSVRFPDFGFPEKPELDKGRAVVMDADFDYYHPLQKRAQVMPMINEVQHHRPRSSDLPEPGASGATPKVRARNEVEVLTRWAVIAGKLMFSSHTLDTVSSIFVLRAMQARLEKSSRVGGWIESRARKVVSQAASLTVQVMEEDGDMYHTDWRSGQRAGALSELFTPEYVDTLMILADASAKVLALQPVLTEAQVPCRIFGDLHGQLRDLLYLFAAYGFPGGDAAGEGGMSYVFNGDFVDRGAHSLEVLGLLMALKVSMPNRVWLVRGNHEDRTMNEKYGFLEECQDRLGENIGRRTHDLFQTAFDQMPLACVVGGQILCVHGGLGDGRWDLNDLRRVRRPLGPSDLDELRWVHNILWSDPIEDDREEQFEEEELGPVFGVHESPRNEKAWLFGWDVTKTWLARNGLAMVVRSHQSKRNGLGFDLMHDERLVRVFSARDYEGHQNDGAVLLVQPRGEGESTAGEDQKDEVHGKKKTQMMSLRAQVLGSYAKAQASL
ncbi:Serine/threonine-protein phosphatase BSU1 (Bri1 suppressor protein 1) [Durusdinium trenchii]|uniref:Serine/threonine-protein phosphatase n=1 Tax=Durusdinium trenchii TaxID=1381693 RepID=A0ABP0MX45_9DINO